MATLRRRVDAIEREQLLLRNTVSGLARDRGLSIGCECSKCNRAYTLVGKTRLFCPACGYERGL
ncbi:hypothetical protein C446_05970 [Halobiforma nitratireducens JCM 10879]|uniref:Uncharacterized protein n=1 Tax=Halobiforma nitratireducens JCM 10879 TaxID=1227454 RepID=M0MB18_9EURY|nr:hypothetical protein C446_05970 [Halobiforma nitratireducens JCM 10879]